MGDQPQEFQQPQEVYPSSSSFSSYTPPSSSRSSGSFGTVFIVLAAILILSAMACVFGRLCNRGDKPHKENNNKKNKKSSKQEKPSSKKSSEIRPVEREPRERGDLEFGFDRKRPGPMSKPSGRNGGDIEFGFDNKKGGGGKGGGKKGPSPAIY